MLRCVLIVPLHADWWEPGVRRVQGVRGVKTMVKTVGGVRIARIRIVWKEVRRCSEGVKKKP